MNKYSDEQNDEENNVVPLVATMMTGGDPTKTMVRLSAPFGLPENYRLPIQYRSAGGQTVSGYARVPAPGVSAGMDFTAEIWEPTPISGHWSHDVLDVRIPDTPFCCLSFFCAPVAWACLYESAVNKSAAGICWLIMAVLMVLFWVSNFMSMRNRREILVDGVGVHTGEVVVVKVLLSSLGWIFVLMACFVRGKLRKKYYISGNWLSDCCCAWFCSCCTAIQAYKHTSSSNEHPRITPTKEYPATLVV